MGIHFIFFLMLKFWSNKPVLDVELGQVKRIAFKKERDTHTKTEIENLEREREKSRLLQEMWKKS